MKISPTIPFVDLHLLLDEKLYRYNCVNGCVLKKDDDVFQKLRDFAIINNLPVLLFQRDDEHRLDFTFVFPYKIMHTSTLISKLRRFFKGYSLFI